MLRRKTPKIEIPALYLVGSERQEPVMRELHERFEQPMHRNFVRSRLYPAEVPVEPDGVPELRWLSVAEHRDDDRYAERMSDFMSAAIGRAAASGEGVLLIVNSEPDGDRSEPLASGDITMREYYGQLWDPRRAPMPTFVMQDIPSGSGYAHYLGSHPEISVLGTADPADSSLDAVERVFYNMRSGLPPMQDIPTIIEEARSTQ